MPIIDFGKVEENQTLIPEIGEYLVKVFKVPEMKYTKNGDEMWMLNLRIEKDCPWYGMFLKDNIIFSTKALPRAKHILKAFGINLETQRNFEPGELLDKYANVYVDSIKKYSYNDKTTGEEKQGEQAVIAYHGYSKVGEEMIPKTEAEDDLPF